METMSVQAVIDLLIQETTGEPLTDTVDVEWLQERLPDVPIAHVPAGDPFCHM